MVYLVIGLLIAGCVLVVAELFTVGFGLFGVLGLISFVAAVICTAIAPELGLAYIIVEVIAVVGFCYLIFYIAKATGTHKKVILNDKLKEDESSKKSKDLIGVRGIAKTDLRPYGKIRVGNDEYSVSANGSYISKGTEVEIIKIKDNNLIVEDRD